jgi:hypothetical protein
MVNTPGAGLHLRAKKMGQPHSRRDACEGHGGVLPGLGNFMRSAPFIAVASFGAAILGNGASYAADISLHVDDNCQGAALSTSISDHDVNYPVASVRVHSGDWEICRDTNFSNCVPIAKTGCSNLEDVSFWGQVRSVKLSEADLKAEATIYRDAGFSGPAVYMSTPKPDTDIYNLPIRSIRVKGGEWQLCTKKNFKGTCKNVSNDIPDLASIGMSGIVKSLRPIRGAVAPNPVGEASFHVRRSCDGAAYATTVAVTNMNYPVRSVLVRSGEWEFCTGENYGGSCKRATKGCTNMIEAGLWGQVRSVRPVASVPEIQPR